MTWKNVDADVLELFGEAFHTRGHVQRAEYRAAAASRTYDFGELSAARFGLRTSRKAKSEEAREMTRYYFRKWKAAVKADPVKAARFRAQACAYARKGWVKLKADPVRLAKRKAIKCASYARNKATIRKRRNAQTTPETRRKWSASSKAKAAADADRAAHEKVLAKARRDRWYASLKKDPERYAKFLARCGKANLRRYHATAIRKPAGWSMRSRARAAGISYEAVRGRMRRGLSEEQAFEALAAPSMPLRRAA